VSLKSFAEPGLKPMNRLNQSPKIVAILGLVIAVSLGVARSEKVWAEALGHTNSSPLGYGNGEQGHEPFDPRRVPQSGGMASRLLAGITAKPV
jgi:hypothetical protein